MTLTCQFIFHVLNSVDTSEVRSRDSNISENRHVMYVSDCSF